MPPKKLARILQHFESKKSKELNVIDIIHECINDLKNENIFLYYNGTFPYEIISEIAEIIMNKTIMDDVNSMTRNRLFAVIVEQMQNMYFYSGKNHNDVSTGEGTIMVGAESGQFFVICANKIATQKIDPLREKIESLNAMSKDELKAYYKQRRKQEPEIDSKGASLGLIEIARRSRKPLQFCFKEIDDEYSFFTLKTIV
jgi:hypothetical protein